MFTKSAQGIRCFVETCNPPILSVQQCCGLTNIRIGVDPNNAGLRIHTIDISVSKSKFTLYDSHRVEKRKLPLLNSKYVIVLQLFSRRTLP
jgi:hypothetical protein